jgi:DNA-binding GntR family transcriptional regulator
MSGHAREAIALRRAQSLTAIVQKELERLIVSGEIRSGERLNEQTLARRFDISRGPIREAMYALERAGLLSTRLNQGFFVREISPEEIAELYDVRAVVYGFICQRLASHIADDELDELESCIRRMDEAIDAKDPAAYYQLNLQFHDASIRFARHERARQSYESLINETHLSRQRSLDTPERMCESNNEHKALIAALRAGDADMARRLGEEHALAGRRRWEATLGAGAIAEEPVRISAAPGPKSEEARSKSKKASRPTA